MADDDKTSWTGKYDLETKTARPKSVGPHDAKRDQEDPAEPGIRPEEGYGAEIARNNDAAAAGRPARDAPVKPPKPKGEAPASPPARDAPPLRSGAGG